MGSTISVLSVEQRQHSSRSRREEGAKALPTVCVVTRRRSSLERLFVFRNDNASTSTGERRQTRHLEGRQTDTEQSSLTANGEGGTNSTAEGEIVTPPGGQQSPSLQRRARSMVASGASSGTEVGAPFRQGEPANLRAASSTVSSPATLSSSAGNGTNARSNLHRLRSYSTSSIPAGSSFGIYQHILSRQLRQVGLASPSSSGSASPRSHQSSGNVSPLIPHRTYRESSGSSTPLGITVVRRDSFDANGNPIGRTSSPTHGNGGSGTGSPRSPARGRWFGRLFNGRRHSTGNLQSVQLRTTTPSGRSRAGSGSESTGTGNTSAAPAVSTERTLFHHQNMQQRDSTNRIIMLAESLFQILDDIASPGAGEDDAAGAGQLGHPRHNKMRPIDEPTVKELPTYKYCRSCDADGGCCSTSAQDGERAGGVMDRVDRADWLTGAEV